MSVAMVVDMAAAITAGTAATLIARVSRSESGMDLRFIARTTAAVTGILRMDTVGTTRLFTVMDTAEDTAANPRAYGLVPLDSASLTGDSLAHSVYSPRVRSR